MQDLAKSLSRHWRVGVPWLVLSSCHHPERNAEIARQRLDPWEVLELDQPDMSYPDMSYKVKMKSWLLSQCLPVQCFLDTVPFLNYT